MGPDSGITSLGLIADRADESVVDLEPDSFLSVQGLLFWQILRIDRIDGGDGPPSPSFRLQILESILSF
jgi:hypothetical protein